MATLARRIAKKLFHSPITNPIRPLYYSLVFLNRYFGPRIADVFVKAFKTDEFGNFTYDLTESNLAHLAHAVAVATGVPLDRIRTYLEEPRNDTVLRQHVLNVLRDRNERVSTLELPFGRRLGWYAIARCLKPRILIETGVERGHGAVLLCAALMRNAMEGVPGRYFGTDIHPRAGWLLTGKYAEVGKILYGDSINSLKTITGPIDLFINDSDHSPDYEYREYQTVKDKLSPRALILGDNAHMTDALMRFSEETNREFLFFREEPKNHWYPGVGFGISFPQ
jgi:hypothetical protein